MENIDNSNPLNEIIDSGKEYLYLKIDQIKLKSVENLSLLTNKMIFTLLASMLGGVILQLLGFAASFFIGSLLGSYALGFVIVAGFFLLILAILYVFKDRLFTNKLVQLFIKMFYPKPKTEEAEQWDS